MSEAADSPRLPVRWGRVALALGAVVWPVVPHTLALQELSYVVSVDALVLLLWVVAWPRGRPLALVAYALLLIWEVVRSLGASLMDQDPLLFDLAYLVRHFVVLGRDLLEGWFVPVVIGVGLALALGAAVGLALLRGGRSGPRAEWVGVALGAALITWAAGGPARFSAVALAGNLRDSVQIAADVDGLIAAPAYQRYGQLQLQARPDVHVYIVESYGRILHRRDKHRERWVQQTRARDRRLRIDGGYQTVSAWATAPVSGGRSWLADATVLTGRHVAHESVFNQVMGRIDEVVHLPGVLAAQGYQTVLVRPKDRARPGVALRNDLAFQRPVFFDDLGYQGPPVGWGWVPDQYTLGWLRAELLGGPAGPPRFVFAHLVSSHAPWMTVPSVVDDWRSLGRPREAAAEPVEVHEADTRGPIEELWVQLGRYQRRQGHRGQRRATADHMQRYADAVAYDLDVLTDHLLGLPERPALVVLMGDHQPPLVARRDDFDVPIHVLSRDPELLAALRSKGFVPGWELPPQAEAALKLEGLMSLLLHAVASADGEALPVWPDGPPLPEG